MRARWRGASVASVFDSVLDAAIFAVLLTMLLVLIRAVMGPTVCDRLLAANSLGTKTVLLIALGGYAMSWHSFLDVALLYAMVNFVGTVAVMRFFEYSNQDAQAADEERAP